MVAGLFIQSDQDEESLKRRRIPAVWQLLKDNILAHRKRKMQDEDDIMICHCKPTWRGGDGCGPDCINRMLCIECVPVSLCQRGIAGWMLKRELGKDHFAGVGVRCVVMDAD